MSPAEIAQLAIILAPIASKIVHDGTQMIVEFKEDLTDADLAKALENSKSALWPKLDFSQAGK